MSGLTEPLQARRIVIEGSVQGRGFRPRIARLASSLGICGCVRNSMRGVLIDAHGSRSQLDRFLARIERELADAADVLWSEPRPPADRLVDGFRIDSSDIDSRYGETPVATPVPRDLAVCSNCLAEIFSPGDRRSGYPFTSCADCGPRYSIIESMPYDRDRTSMSDFAMCPDCLGEYRDPSDRRFHAQTNSCPACGPAIRYVDAGGEDEDDCQRAVAAAIERIRDGKTAAIQGLGGYQLVCDATDEHAVRRLRSRKRRPAKPLAVMVESLERARELAEVSAQEACALSGPAGPVVLIRSSTRSPLCEGVHPGMNLVGLMLPTTPLHALICRGAGCPLVVTSGNVDGEPIEFESESARTRLASVADCFLDHDRRIVRPIDDSVVRVICGRLVTIRAGRGIAPLPIRGRSSRPAVALGGHQKTAIAISNGQQTVLAPHLGDLDTIAARERFASQVDSLKRLYAVDDDVPLVHDEHPDYHSTRWAESQSVTDRYRVQHHHAHVVAAMAEADLLDREVLGVAMDGTGYGGDGTVWGGEFLLSSADRFRRVAHLRTFPLPGGERAIREPWRTAAALMIEAGIDDWIDIVGEMSVNREQAVSLAKWVNTSLSPRTSSIGRLFDGVAAITLSLGRADFQGQPAMWLESICDADDVRRYPLPIRELACGIEIDPRPMTRSIVAEYRSGVAPSVIATRFHRSIAAVIAEMASRYPGLPLVLCGGVFQNRVLVEMVAESLTDHPSPLVLPGRVPPGDGGLSLGQLASVLHAAGNH